MCSFLNPAIMAPCSCWTMSSNALSAMNLRKAISCPTLSLPPRQALLSVEFPLNTSVFPLKKKKEEKKRDANSAFHVLFLCSHSYQEMITHLALNAHPNPRKVLVIGGGDGGVLREVVKHSTVESAILCDIDESVIRLSKKYLPGMSIGFQHPNVTVHVGDGFKFLADRKNEFDVIITDSSDPEGPAESLFQKPYFELLYGALRDGGVVSTQGCPSPFIISRFPFFPLCILFAFHLPPFPPFSPKSVFFQTHYPQG